jgi:hypothetical protein
MELYLNSTWTERYANSYYVAEAMPAPKTATTPPFTPRALLPMKQTPNS